MKKISAVLVYVLLLLFILTGCGAKVVAVVNGEKISEEELNTRVSQFAAMYGYDVENPDNKEMIGYLKQQVMEYLIEEKIILQSAKERKLEVKNEDVEAELDSIKGQLGDEEKFKEFLAERKFTEKDLKTFISNQLILNKLIYEVTRDITTSDRDPKEYYEEYKSEFYEPEKIQARNIVVRTEAEALDIISRLDKGEDFAKLAVELSIDPSAKDNEGLIDYFDSTAMLVDEFKDAAFALKVGEYTKEPVKSLYGFHIIKVEDRIAAKTRTFEEVKDELVNRFIMEEKNEKFMEFVDDLMEKAVIERKLPEATPPPNGGEEEPVPEDTNPEGMPEQEETASPDGSGTAENSTGQQETNK